MMMRNRVLSELSREGARGAFNRRVAHLADDSLLELADDDIAALAVLGDRYVQETLRLLESCVTAARQARADAVIAPIATACERFYLEPPGFDPDHPGLFGLACSSYLARELIACVSDQTRRLRGFPLIASPPHPERDIIAAMLGRDLAAQLDRIVEDAFARPDLRFACNGAFALNGSLRASGMESDWDASWTEDARRYGAEVGISFT